MHLILHKRCVPSGPTSAGKRTSLTSRKTLCSGGSSISSLSLSFSLDGTSSSSESSSLKCPSSSIVPCDLRFDDDFLESDDDLGRLRADVVLPANSFFTFFHQCQFHLQIFSLFIHLPDFLFTRLLLLFEMMSPS